MQPRPGLGSMLVSVLQASDPRSRCQCKECPGLSQCAQQVLCLQDVQYFQIPVIRLDLQAQVAQMRSGTVGAPWVFKYEFIPSETAEISKDGVPHPQAVGHFILQTATCTAKADQIRPVLSNMMLKSRQNQTYNSSRLYQGPAIIAGLKFKLVSTAPSFAPVHYEVSEFCIMFTFTYPGSSQSTPIPDVPRAVWFRSILNGLLCREHYQHDCNGSTRFSIAVYCRFPEQAELKAAQMGGYLHKKAEGQRGTPQWVVSDPHRPLSKVMNRAGQVALITSGYQLSR